MNNFKKLLASAMALTMVTSVLPATSINAAATPDKTEVGYIDDALVSDGKTAVNKLIAAFGDKWTIDTITTTEQVTIDSAPTTVGAFATANVDALKHLVASGEGTTTQINVATKLVGEKNKWINFNDSALNLVEGINNLVDFYKEDGTYVGKDLDKAGYNEVLAVYNLINTYDGSLANLNTS